MAIDSALSDVKNKRIGAIPNRLKDAHYSGSKKLNHGNDYIYPHDYPSDWIAQQYLPNNLMGVQYFNAKGNSKIEKGLKKQYEILRKMQAEGLN